ncbi:LysR substrate-binding domain-containing protein [uncultured Bradyrhizobium sp.]|uniref:LysR substrate-binding domain-containing protein n=1 Tax=uncultured Bradyrhizobium sp. TaxID=199684 RepID=UPI0035CA921A
MELIDPELLRTFLAFAEAGSLVRAAATVGRSPSAITLQMHRLEEIIGEPLLAVAGRGRVLTPAGEELIGHARRILAAHRDAWLRMKGARSGGRTRLGCTQDFADSSLPELLRAFAESHARVRIDLRIGRSDDLSAAYDQGDIDILLAMRLGPRPDEVKVLREPMIWLAAETGLAGMDDVVPLALLDPPCGFRSAAIAALDTARRGYRIAATSPSLAGLKAAVRSGLAVTPRTVRMLERGIGLAASHLSLPDLPEAEYTLRIRRDAERQSSYLATLLAEGLSVQIG